jgi:LysR family hydrogen peroxide-inducible transcriptional activator
MNIRNLEYLVALAKYRHFQRAAEACNVSQPTLSAQLRKLENELGLQLLERTTRKSASHRRDCAWSNRPRLYSGKLKR